MIFSMIPLIIGLRIKDFSYKYLVFNNETFNYIASRPFCFGKKMFNFEQRKYGERVGSTKILFLIVFFKTKFGYFCRATIFSWLLLRMT